MFSSKQKLNNQSQLSVDSHLLQIRLRRLKWIVLDAKEVVPHFNKESEKIQAAVKKLLDGLLEYIKKVEDTPEHQKHLYAIEQAVHRWNQGEKDFQDQKKEIENLLMDCKDDGDKKATQLILDDINACYASGLEPTWVEKQHAEQQDIFEKNLDEIKKLEEDEKPSCFISYAWGIPAHEKWVHQLAQQLQRIGVEVYLDIWHNRFGSIPEFTEKLCKVDYVIIIGTPKLLEKWQDNLEIGYIVKQELQQIFEVKRKTPEKIIKLLLDSEYDKSFPRYMNNLAGDAVDFRCEKNYFPHFFNLLEKLFENKPAKLAKIVDHKQAFDKQCTAIDKEYLQYVKSLNVAVKVIETKSLPAKNQYEGQQQQERDAQEKQEAQNIDFIIKNLLSKSPMAAFAKNNVNTLSLKEKPERNLRESNLQGLDFKEEIELAGIAGSQKPQMNAQKEQNNSINDHNLEERNQKFVGREQFFERIYQFLQRKEKSVITYTIQGLGGIGKTQLALEYAYRRLKDYRLVWRLNGENIESDYAQLADSLGVSLINTPNQQQLIRAVNSKLKNKDKWLLIIDNAPSYEAIKLYLPTGPGHVLITSRSTANWQTKITLEVFDRKESIAYFKNELSELINKNKANLINDADFEKQANRLAALLGDLPLALAQAAAYINQAETDLAAYTKLFVQKRKELWSQEEPPRDYNNTIKTTWSISLKSLNDKSFELINAISLMGSAPIPRKWVNKYFEDNTLIANSALITLNKLSLVTLDPKQVVIHQLLRAVIQDDMLPDALTKRKEQAAKALIGFCPSHDEPKSEKCYLPLIPHFNELTRQQDWDISILFPLKTDLGLAYDLLGQPKQALAVFKELLKFQKKVDHNKGYIARTLTNLGNTYGVLGDAVMHKICLEEAVDLKRKSYGPHHPEVIISEINSANALDNTTQQKIIFEKIWKDFENNKKNNEFQAYLNKPIDVIILMNLGNACVKTGETKKGEDKLKQALEIFKAYYKSEDHLYVVLALMNLSHLYNILGDVKQQKEYTERALLAIQHKIFPLANFTSEEVKLLRDFAGSVCQKLKDLTIKNENDYIKIPFTDKEISEVKAALDKSENDEAKKIKAKLIVKSGSIVNNQVPTVTKLLNHLCNAYIQLKNSVWAGDILEEVLTLQESYYDNKDHPELEITLINLANAYEGLNDLRQRKKQLERIMVIRMKQYKDESYPKIVEVRYLLSIVCWQLGEYQNAQTHLLAIWPIIKKPENDYTIAVARLLAKCKLALADLKQKSSSAIQAANNCQQLAISPMSKEAQREHTLALCQRFFKNVPEITKRPDAEILRQDCHLVEKAKLANHNIQIDNNAGQTKINSGDYPSLFQRLCHWLSINSTVDVSQNNAVSSSLSAQPK